ncbi:MAG: NAD-dependent epimerase/dehydratase family protein [Paraglaciecola sp.]|uniref:NAD-dependent epimerase/dehydratase family protein n=1 Tax=Paraglaciecola sp. TaxID=1920173 RepID=UPI003267E05D
MQHVLITGGAGFIGSHLTKELCSKGYSVRILDNLSPQIHGDSAQIPEWVDDLSVEFHRGCITNRADVKNALEDIDIVIHLAAETGTGQSMYEIQKYNDVNSQGTAVLLDIIANKETKSVKRILLASSRSVYGEGAYTCSNCADKTRQCPDSRTAQVLAEEKWDPLCSICGSSLTPLPTKETDSIKPASIYAATKFAQEHLISVFCESQGIGFGILRLQNVYGEGQSLNNPYTGILSIFSTRIRRDLNLPIFEDGNETRDFIHVSDVANSFLAAITTHNSPNCIVNVGTGQLTTVKEVATKLTTAFGKTPNITVTGEYRIGDIRHNRADITLLKDKLNYTPKVDLEKGLKSFVDWVQSQDLPEDLLDKANNELKAKNLMG